MHLHASMESTDQLLILIISSVSLMTLVTTLIFCLCCRRRNLKSELAGVEGIVKLKNLDDSNLTVSIDTTDSVNVKTRLAQKNATLPLDAKLNGFQDSYELKRSSANAPHRSLPDIPIAETTERDNNSELYATVGDKFQEKPQIRNSLNVEKSTNISQHSSMSQADDVSSPYARVKSMGHAYDKLKKTEHPYAQVVQPVNGGVAQVVDENDDEDDDDDDEDEDDDTTIENPIAHRESSSNNDLLNPNSCAIDASAAISGRISASQELPYMTPPIVTGPQNQQHFSGDSQDSSKGYTSISVREPLANIIAQTKQQNAERRRRQVHDSHYATVSDDSEEETYAAIEEPNNAGELYTSGSETYAQIQAPITVSVEINPVAPIPQLPSTSQQSNNRFSRTNPINTIDETVETLKNLHSRQASSSSCTSSVGNIGSPKPEKRQANSPLPPTPKSQHHTRNSTSSIMEYQEGAKLKDSNNNSNKVKQSPSKDLEGMYAKVMKKSKLSSLPADSQLHAFPLIETTPKKEMSASVHEIQINEYETIDKKRNRMRISEGGTSDAGYETIPADRNNNTNKDEINSSSPHYAKIKEKNPKAKMSLFQDVQDIEVEDPKYETLKHDKKPKPPSSIATDSDYDPNYEILMKKSSAMSEISDEGYAKIRKGTKDSSDDESIPGYSTIKKLEPDYSSIQGVKIPVNSINEEADTDSNIYQSIPAVVTPSTDSNSSELLLSTATSNSAVTPTMNNYDSLSNSESTTLEEPNYESMRFLNENPYEKLHNEKDMDSTISPLSDKKSPAVDDFFNV